MRPEVVLACLTLCLVEAGSSFKRRHLTTVLFVNSFRLAPKPLTSVVEDVADSAGHWTDGDELPDLEPSTLAFLRSFRSLSSHGSRDTARDLLPIFRHRHPDRAQLLRNVLRQVAARQWEEDRPVTSVMTKRQRLPSVEKRRRRYRCDLNRVTLQMILSYFRNRTLCGFRVTRMRFGLGGK